MFHLNCKKLKDSPLPIQLVENVERPSFVEVGGVRKGSAKAMSSGQIWCQSPGSSHGKMGSSSQKIRSTNGT